MVTVDDDDAARAAVGDGDADLAVLDGASAIVVDEPIDADDDSDLAAVVNVLRSDIALTDGLAEAGLSPEEIAAAVSHEPPAVESLDADAGRGRQRPRRHRHLHQHRPVPAAADVRRLGRQRRDPGEGVACRRGAAVDASPPAS